MFNFFRNRVSPAQSMEMQHFSDNTITRLGNKKFKIVNKNLNCTVEKIDKSMRLYKENHTYKLDCERDDHVYKKKELEDETELIDYLELSKNRDCNDLNIINNENNYKEIISRLGCPINNIDQFLYEIKSKIKSQTKEELFMVECIKEIDDIIKKSINSQTRTTLGFINSGIFTSCLITSNAIAVASFYTAATVSVAVPVIIPLIASIGMLVLLANSLHKHYNKYNELNRVIYLIFKTTLRYYNIFNMMLKITKIHNFKLNDEGFTSILSKLLNQLFLLATPEVFNEIKEVIHSFNSSRENDVFRLFINIQKKRDIANEAKKVTDPISFLNRTKNWFTSNYSFFSPDENIVNLGTLINILTQEFVMTFSEFLLVLKVKEYNYDNTKKNSLDCKHKEWSNSIEYKDLLAYSNIKDTEDSEESEEKLKKNFKEIIENLKENDIDTSINRIQEKLKELKLDNTQQGNLILEIVRAIKNKLNELEEGKINMSKEDLLEAILLSLNDTVSPETIKIIELLIKERDN
jgi:hypothetical protein